MRKTAIFVGVFVALLIAAPLLGVLWTRSGPTATGPTEDPIIRLNREHADLAANAADLYAEAFASLAAEPPNVGVWRRGDPVPPEATAYVADNAAAIDQARKAAEIADCWFPLVRGPEGDVKLPFHTQMRDLAKRLGWRARLAAERRDWAELADSVRVSDRIGRHAQQTPLVIPHLLGIACMAISQHAVLGPYEWTELSREDRTAYTERIVESFQPPAAFAEAIGGERDEDAWMYRTQMEMPTAIRILASPERFCGELDRTFAPLRQLAEQPVHEHVNPLNPLRVRILEMADEPAPRLNPARMFVQILTPSMLRNLEFRVRIVTEQRGNRTVVELFTIRDRTGQFPETLDGIDADFKLDPFTGQPFVYRITDDGFTLYSTGLDRDDDGGTHHPRFGEQRPTRGQPAPPPDGDYVFWPIPEPEPEPEPAAPCE